MKKPKDNLEEINDNHLISEDDGDTSKNDKRLLRKKKIKLCARLH